MEPMDWFAGLAALFVAELLWQGISPRTYFSYGIPLFFRRCALEQPLPELSPDTLTAWLPEETVYPRVSFFKLGPDFHAIGPAFLAGGISRYAPVMHGVIRVEPGRKAFQITGRANWWMVYMPILLLIWLVETGSVMDLVLMFVATAIWFLGIWWLERSMYLEICAILENLARIGPRNPDEASVNTGTDMGG